MGTERLYTQGEVKKIFPNIPGNTLTYWARQDLVPCADERQDGRGVHRLYSLNNLYVLGVVEKLFAWRIRPHIVRSVVKDIVDSTLSLEADLRYIGIWESETTQEFEPLYFWGEESLDELKKQNFITSAVVDVAGVKKLIDKSIKASGV